MNLFVSKLNELKSITDRLIALAEKGDLPGHPFRGNQWEGGGGGRETFSGGSESYSDRIEGTQAEADREVNRAAANITKIKRVLSDVTRLQDEAAASMEVTKNKAIGEIRKKLEIVQSKIEFHRQAAERSKVRLKRLKELSKKRPSKWTPEERDEITKMDQERKADEEAAKGFEKSSGGSLMESEVIFLGGRIKQLERSNDEADVSVMEALSFLKKR